MFCFWLAFSLLVRRSDHSTCPISPVYMRQLQMFQKVVYIQNVLLIDVRRNLKSRSRSWWWEKVGSRGWRWSWCLSNMILLLANYEWLILSEGQKTATLPPLLFFSLQNWRLVESHCKNVGNGCSAIHSLLYFCIFIKI